MLKLNDSLSIVMAAGGTGGHMFPGHVLADELIKRGHKVALITDHRGASYPGLFDGIDRRLIKAGNLSGGLWAKLKSAVSIIAGLLSARSYLKERHADMVVGFGGYPAFPAMMAARMMGIPYCLHEQNAVMGRVNRKMAPDAKAIALSFDNTQKVPEGAKSRVQVVGNPVREAFRVPAKPLDENAITLMVVGGSQGARILSDTVPAAIQALPSDLKKKLSIVQQCRPEDVARVEAVYRGEGIRATCPSFIEDMPSSYHKADIIIARSGAMTVSEIAAAGKAAILVPLAIAVDNHQYYNACALADQGGAVIIEEKDFNPAHLTKYLTELLAEPEQILTMAQRAATVDHQDAVIRLADMIEAEAHKIKPEAHKIKQRR